MVGTRETDLLNLLYRAVAQPDLWPSFLAGFADRLGAGSAWISHLHVSDGGGGGLVVRMDGQAQQAYFEQFQAIDPLSRPSPAGLRYPGIVCDGDLIAREDLRQSRFYNEFLVPNDVDAVLMVRLFEGKGRLQTLNVNRPAGRDTFTDEELRLAAFFRSHIAVAADLSHRMALHRFTAGRAAGLHQGMIVLGSQHRVVYIDGETEADWFAPGFFKVSGGRLASPYRSVQERLDRLLVRADQAVGVVRQGGHAIAQLREGMTISLTVIPLHAHETSPFSDDAAVAVIVSNIEQEGHDALPSAARMFGFTPAESEVAQSLLQGLSIADIAKAKHVSVNTVRTHVAHLLSKAGCSRQIDFVRRLVTHRAPSPKF